MPNVTVYVTENNKEALLRIQTETGQGPSGLMAEAISREIRRLEREARKSGRDGYHADVHEAR